VFGVVFIALLKTISLEGSEFFYIFHGKNRLHVT